METRELCKILGWQGGTIHQVKREVKRLKEIEKAAKDFGDAVAFAWQVGQINKKNEEIAAKGKILNNVLTQVID